MTDVLSVEKQLEIIGDVAGPLFDSLPETATGDCTQVLAACTKLSDKALTKDPITRGIAAAIVQFATGASTYFGHKTHRGVRIAVSMAMGNVGRAKVEAEPVDRYSYTKAHQLVQLLQKGQYVRGFMRRKTQEDGTVVNTFILKPAKWWTEPAKVEGDDDSII